MATAILKPQFYRNLSLSLKKATEDFDAAFDAVISSSIFPWPRITIRKYREPAGSPRDIVDSGAFRNSQSYSFPSPLLARFIWDIEYAAIILYGATLRNGGRIEARDWISETFEQVDAEDILGSACRRIFR